MSHSISYVKRTEAHFRAIEIFEGLLRADEEKLGAGHEDLTARRLDLAKAYRKAGMTACAIRHLDQLLGSELAGREEHDPEVAQVKCELALNYSELGCYAEALLWTRQVLATDLRNKGHRHIDIAYGLDFQAELHFQLGDWEQGISLLKEAYLSFRAICGEEDEMTKRLRKKLDGYL